MSEAFGFTFDVNDSNMYRQNFLSSQELNIANHLQNKIQEGNLNAKLNMRK